MPPRKTKRAYKKKRTYRRRRRNNPRRPILSGFPSKKLVKLRYVDTGVNLDAPSAGMAQTIYRANSCFDPYQPTGGHQPMGYDQWSAIYEKYTVLGSKITMKWNPLAVANLTPGRFGILLSTDTVGVTNFSTINSLLESKLIGNAYKTFGPYDSATNNRACTTTKKFSAKRFFGKVNVVDGSANTALTSTNPGNEAYFIPWVAAIASAQDPEVATFTITIDYIVQFSNPRILDGS